MRWGKGSARLLYPEPLDVIKSYQLQSLEQHKKKTLKYFLISFLVRHFYSCLNFSFSKNYTGRNGKRNNCPWHQRPNTSSGVDWFRFLTHSVCHGAIRFLLHLWIDSSNHKESWYLPKNKRGILYARLFQMKPPYDVTRTRVPWAKSSCGRHQNSGHLPYIIFQLLQFFYQVFIISMLKVSLMFCKFCFKKKFYPRKRFALSEKLRSSMGDNIWHLIFICWANLFKVLVAFERNPLSFPNGLTEIRLRVLMELRNS